MKWSKRVAELWKPYTVYLVKLRILGNAMYAYKNIYKKSTVNAINLFKNEKVALALL